MFRDREKLVGRHVHPGHSPYTSLDGKRILIAEPVLLLLDHSNVLQAASTGNVAIVAAAAFDYWELAY